MTEANGIDKVPDGVEETAVPKKSYSTPQLVVYGDLRVIAATRRRTGADGGAPGTNFSN